MHSGHLGASRFFTELLRTFGNILAAATSKHSGANRMSRQTISFTLFLFILGLIYGPESAQARLAGAKVRLLPKKSSASQMDWRFATLSRLRH
jgi:hypothetical protein